jgi:hypothetical protein
MFSHRHLCFHEASWLPVLIAGAFALSFNASAIIDANSSSNTNAPTDGSPWSNVGAVNGASSVYLGGGWVLTASHVGVGSVYFNNISYAPDGSSLRLTNSDGSVTDLIMFHLVAYPPLPGLPVASSTPSFFSQIDMIGHGFIAGSPQTTFGNYTGFSWSAAQFKSWGNNKVDLGGTMTINIGYGTLTAYTTDFTSPGTIGPTSQTSDEGQVAPGDSGGGVFQMNGSSWELVGLLDAELYFTNQPASTSVYGDGTYVADVATYRSQIVSVLAASPVPNLSVATSGNSVLVCWPDTGVSYKLESTTSLNPASWVSASQSQSAGNGRICVEVPATGASQYFRLQAP